MEAIEERIKKYKELNLKNINSDIIIEDKNIINVYLDMDNYNMICEPLGPF